MPKNSKNIGLPLAVLLPLVFSLSACVPVVIIAVGATAGSGVMDEKSRPETQQNPQPATKGEAVIQAPEPKPEASVEAMPSSEIKTAQTKLKVHVPEKMQTLSPVPEKLPSEALAQTTKQALALQDKTPAVPQRSELSLRADGKSSHDHSEAATVNDLINKGWKASLSEPQQNNMLEVTLYFDPTNQYYGFDGCKHFKGKYVASPSNQLLIKSLIVSSEGSAECGNEIERNLFFVNLFTLHDKDIYLSNNDKLVMSLSQIEHFNANAFLTKAKVKYRTEKNLTKNPDAKKTSAKKAPLKNSVKKVPLKKYQ
jgi:heat shock protein HslJ